MTLNVLNILLRGLTLSSKFVLIIFLAKVFSPEDLGIFGILQASISYSLYFIGLDFYIYTTREIIKRKEGNWGDIIKNQIVVATFLYLIFVPIVMLLFYKNILPMRLLFWFFLLVFVEYVAQEINRILISLSEQLFASLVLFLRSGLWSLFSIYMMIRDAKFQNIEFVLCCWLVGGGIACVFGFWRIIRKKPMGWSLPVNWGWIQKGVYISFPFLLSTLCLRGILTLDRYWIKHIAGLEVVGAYVLFISLSNALVSFMDAGIFVFTYPSLIMAFELKDRNLFLKKMKRFTKLSLSVGLSFSIISIISIKYILLLLKKSVYLNYVWMFPIVMISILVYCIGFVPQHGLYAQGRDRYIIISHIGSLVVFIVSTYALSLFLSESAVPVGVFVSMLFGLILKLYFYYKVTYRSMLGWGS